VHLYTEYLKMVLGTAHRVESVTITHIANGMTSLKMNIYFRLDANF